MVLSEIVYETIIIFSNFKKQKKEILRANVSQGADVVHEIFLIKIQNVDQNDVIAF